MKYKDPKTTCSIDGCENLRRSGGRYCSGCHAQHQREARGHAKVQREQFIGGLAAAIRRTKRRCVLEAIREESGNLSLA
jgi:hypothetical protein